jgi:hypothetical protein
VYDLTALKGMAQERCCSTRLVNSFHVFSFCFGHTLTRSFYFLDLTFFTEMKQINVYHVLGLVLMFASSVISMALLAIIIF